MADELVITLFFTRISVEKCNSSLIGPQECNYVENRVFTIVQCSTGTRNGHYD